jgi:hypothetical protein
MVNQEILEGLRTALARGYPLQTAMMSFFNAGYKKEEIEEAARALYAHPAQPLSHPEKPSAPEDHKEERPVLTKPLPTTPTTAKPEPEKEKPVVEAKAEISKYEEKTKPKGKLKIILLIISLIVLLGALAAIFVFKEQIINFFGNLFA